MSSYLAQRTQSDLYLEAFKDILEKNSLHFLNYEVSSEKEDTQEATDMVIKVKGGTVALRVREPNCMFRDLTIRSRALYGGKTEIHKLREGFGKWYLYGWGDGAGKINEYILVDLDIVRMYGLLDKTRRENSNFDGTKFISIPIAELQLIGAIVNKKLTDETIEKFIEPEIKKLVNY